MIFRKIFTRFGQMPLIIVPVALLSAFIGFSRHSSSLAFLYARMLAVILGVTFTIGALIKFIYHKERPHPKKYTNWFTKIDASSFPSIHTAYATVIMIASILIPYLSYKNQPIITILTGCLGVAFYGLMAYSRIILKKHFFIDIIFGTLLGVIAFAFAVFHIDAIVAAAQLIHNVFFG